MSIFDKQSPIQEKIISIVRKNEDIFMIHRGWSYNMAPSPVAKMNIPPNVMGVDQVIKKGMQIKGIVGNLGVKIEETWTPNCDVSLFFNKDFMDGWIYSMKGERIKFSDTLVWICPYLKMVMDNRPEIIHLSLVQ